MQSKFIAHPLLILTLLYFQLPIEKLLICYCLYCFTMIVFNSYWIKKNKELSSSLKLTFFINLIKYISLLTFFVFAWLYFVGVLHYSILLLVNIGLIISMAYRLPLAVLPRTYVDGQFADFMESIQFLIISLKIIGIINPSWEWGLCIYDLFVTFLTYLGIPCAFFFPIMIGISFIHPPQSNDRKTLQFSSWVFFHIFWKGICYYYLYENLIIFLNANGLSAGTTIFITDQTLIPITIFYLVGGIINLVWFLQQRELFCRIISIKLMILNKSKGVKREIIEVPFNMKIVQAGTNYFKNLISTKNIPKTFELPTDKKVEMDTDCMICCSNESNILIRPCNHGGVCERCIITYLGTNNACPHCKVKITKIYVMEHNKDKNQYFGTKVLTLV